MRDINRSTILELIRRNGPVGRSEIADEHNVSLPTVMRIVEELIANGLVVEDRVKEWSGGRRRARVRFNGSQHLVICVDLGGDAAYGAIADLNGEVCHELHRTNASSHSNESLELIWVMIDQLLEKSREIGSPVRGIAVGVPGTVDPHDGVVRRCLPRGWEDFPLKDQLAARYPYPIAVENNVNLAALGETWFGSEGSENNLVLLSIGSFVGAGVVINGSVYTGSNNMAGAVAHFLPEKTRAGVNDFEPSTFAQIGSGPALVRQAQRMLADVLSPAQLDELSARSIFIAAENHEPWALQIRASFIDSLVQLLIAFGVVLDPEVILLRLGMTDTPEQLLALLLKRLQRKGHMAAPCRFRSSVPRRSSWVRSFGCCELLPTTTPYKNINSDVLGLRWIRVSSAGLPAKCRSI